MTDKTCIHPLATRPVLYTDTVGGNQTCRDDLWAVTTDELNALHRQAAATDQPSAGLTDERIDQIARDHSLDGSMLNKPRHAYWRMFAHAIEHEVRASLTPTVPQAASPAEPIIMPDADHDACARRVKNFTVRTEPTRDPDFKGEKSILVSYNGFQEYTTSLAPHEARKVHDLIGKEFGFAAPGAAQTTEPDLSTRQGKLRALADRIDHEKLWRVAGLHRDNWSDDQCDRHEAGVMLRRYAEILQPGRWLIIPPTGPVRFSADTIDEVADMAKRHQERKQ